MPAKLIVSAYSGRWLARERLPEVRAALDAAGVEYDPVVSERSRHCETLAAEAARAGFSPIVVAGGDGAMNEVINGLAQVQSGRLGPVGVFPLGTANDFADMIGLPRDFGEAARAIKAGKTKTVDLGRVNGRYFDNNSAIGLEPTVTLQNMRLTWLRGTIRYLVAAVMVVMRAPKWDAKLEWDDGRYEGSVALVTIGNTRRTGGFFMTPEAISDDGLLDIVYAPGMGQGRLFQLLPMALKGTHVNEPEVKMIRSRRLNIRTAQPTPLHTDGEILSETITEARYEIVPGKLQVLAP